MCHQTIKALIWIASILFFIPHAYGEITGSGKIMIGVSGPFSGGSSPMGESMRNGIRLAVEEINSIGGIYGRQIALVERDDQADNAVGAKIAHELTAQKVVATIGIVNTGVGLASIDAYQSAKIPLIVAVSTGPSLTRKYAPPASTDNYIFRVAPTIDVECSVLVNVLERGKIGSVAVLADATAYGEAGLNSFRATAEREKISIASIDRFKIGDRDMTAAIRHAKDSGAQALVVWGIGPELAAIAHSKKTVGWKAPMLGSWTLSMGTFMDQAGVDGEGALMPQTYIENFGNSQRMSFASTYGKKFGTDRISSPMSAAQGYDAMILLFLAIVQAQSLDGSKILSALENLRSVHEGVITSYHKPFSHQDHDAITPNMELVGKVTSGRIVYAYAEDEMRGKLYQYKNHN